MRHCKGRGATRVRGCPPVAHQTFRLPKSSSLVGHEKATDVTLKNLSIVLEVWQALANESEATLRSLLLYQDGFVMRIVVVVAAAGEPWEGGIVKGQRGRLAQGHTQTSACSMGDNGRKRGGGLLPIHISI